MTILYALLVILVEMLVTTITSIYDLTIIQNQREHIYDILFLRAIISVSCNVFHTLGY